MPCCCMRCSSIMNDTSGLALLLTQVIIGVIAYFAAKAKGDAKAKETKDEAAKEADKKTDEAKSYTDELVDVLTVKVNRLENEVNDLKKQNQGQAAQITEIESQRDAARAENHVLNQRLEEERQNFVTVSKRVEELEGLVATLKSQVETKGAVNEAAQEIVKIIREGLAQVINELTAKPAFPPPQPVPTPAAPNLAEGSAT